jgi:3-dehydroquinate synthase
LHGEAVGCGLVLAGALSHRTLGLPLAQVQQIKSVVQAIGCPTSAPRLLGIDQWLSLMRSDKKAQAGEIKFVLMPAIGQAVVTSADQADVAAVLNEHVA